MGHRKMMMGLAVCVIALGAGCARTVQSPDVTDAVNRSLDQAGLRSVHVSEDRGKGVVTLTGDVKSDAEKANAESIAKAAAGNLVVADELSVRPPGAEHQAGVVSSNLDGGIEKNFKAALVARRLDDGIHFSAKNGVLTLTGDVNSQARRAALEKLAATVPNVQQVVNELQVKEQKATATTR